MSDLIDRKEAINAIKKEWEEPLHSGETWEIIERTCDRIYNLPSAESKKGKWKLHKSRALWICTNCKDTSLVTSHFCPNCGAKMEVTEPYKGGDIE